MHAQRSATRDDRQHHHEDTTDHVFTERAAIANLRLNPAHVTYAARWKETPRLLVEPERATVYTMTAFLFRRDDSVGASY